MEAVLTYRKLLKAIRIHITKDASKSFFRDYVAQEFRKNKDLTDMSTIDRKLKLAQDYTTLLYSVHHHKELLYSYNIAVDRSKEHKERMKNTAERVGLKLPESEYEEFEESIWKNI